MIIIHSIIVILSSGAVLLLNLQPSSRQGSEVSSSTFVSTDGSHDVCSENQTFMHDYMSPFHKVAEMYFN